MSPQTDWDEDSNETEREHPTVSSSGTWGGYLNTGMGAYALSNPTWGTISSPNDTTISLSIDNYFDTVFNPAEGNLHLMINCENMSWKKTLKLSWGIFMLLFAPAACIISKLLRRPIRI